MTATKRIAYQKAYYLKNKQHMNEAARKREQKTPSLHVISYSE
jgi:hypothetical protein